MDVVIIDSAKMQVIKRKPIGFFVDGINKFIEQLEEKFDVLTFREPDTIRLFVRKK